jgi:hypothetical protein
MFARKLSQALTCLAVMATQTDVLAQGDGSFAADPHSHHHHSAPAYGMQTPCDAALPPGAPGCQNAADRCTAAPPPRHIYVCPCPSCSQSRPRNPESAYQPESQAQPGAFVAPPQTGTQVSPSRQTSFGGMAIRFPEIRLGLPTIELPNRVTRTRGAHMELDAAVADYRTYPAQPVQRQEYAAAPRPMPRAAEAAPAAPEKQPESAEVDEMRQRCEAMAEQLRNKEALLDEKLSELEQQLQNLRCLPVQPTAPHYPQTAPCDSYPQPNCVPPGSPLGMLSSDGESDYVEPQGVETGTYRQAPGRSQSPAGGQTFAPMEQVPRPAPAHDHRSFQQIPRQSGTPLYGAQTRNGGGKPVVPTAHQVSIPAQQTLSSPPRRLPRPTASR